MENKGQAFIMGVIFFGLGLFLIFFVTHYLIWKIHIPKRQVQSLLILFPAFMILAFLAFHLFLGGYEGDGNLFSLSLVDYIHGCLLFAVLFAAYIVTYPAIEVDSPSLVIITNVAGVGPTGIAKELLEQKLTNELLVKPRIEDLVTEKMIFTGQDGKYRLTAKGYWFILPFSFYRNLIRAGKGG
jgi:hypothetical protein